SLADLDNSLAAVDYSLTIDKQDQIAEWAKAIDDAISNLKYKKADYSALDVLKEKADGIDRSLYTPESLADLDNSLAAVDYSLTIDKQDQIAEWAKAIDDAIANLEYLPADYSVVRDLISKAESIDRKYYSTLSLTVLDNAINSVDYTLDITRQATVDGYAKNIKNAVSNLTYAAITLRHDGCGVIVSATAKEINPYASLSVEKVDSSEYEGTNFAVGGSIRSLNFYDINLVLNGKTVQPAGTVKVKIRLADGVNSSKCKVYHVTDDIVNPLVRYSSTIDGNYIVFETDHFSEFAVIEVETVLESIEITNLPSKTTYSPGENLVTDGLTVTAHMSDGTFLTVSDYTVGMVDLSSIGTKQVSIFYTYGNITKTASFDVTVSGDKSSADILCDGKPTDSVHKKLCLFDFYTKAYIQLDCEAKNAEGCLVSWSSDNEKVLVDSSGRVTCKGLFGAKKATITVTVKDSLGNTVATDKVTVIFYKLSFQLSRLASQTFSFLKKTFFAD
ncbi:MAG: bacterial Ig-like domain-containing protein, partial [Clostridia bacterium]|nr:bacterial Ig-like domain-containing protein [Clostridia bacterium]